jgi:hypothetical protein
MDMQFRLKPLALAMGIIVVPVAFGADQPSETGDTPGYGHVSRPDRTTTAPDGGATSSTAGAIPDFGQLDKDGDGQINRQEFDNMMSGSAIGGTSGGATDGSTAGTVGGGNEAAETGTGESAAEATGSVGGNGSAGSRQSPR